MYLRRYSIRTSPLLASLYIVLVVIHTELPRAQNPSAQATPPIDSNPIQVLDINTFNIHVPLNSKPTTRIELLLNLLLAIKFVLYWSQDKNE